MTLNFAPAKFFDNPDFSDITIIFSGRQIRCHKIILCTNSDYFRTLCGPDSRFKESGLGEIELKDDDPDAVEAVLWYIYTGEFKASKLRDWNYSLELSKAANKYLLPELENWAYGSFLELTNGLVEPAEVLAVMDAIHKSEYPRVLPVVDALEQKHRSALLRYQEYRRRVQADPKLTWQYIDRFNHQDDMVDLAIWKCSTCFLTYLRPLQSADHPKCYGHIYGATPDGSCKLTLLSTSCWVSKVVAEHVNHSPIHASSLY